MVRFQNPKSAYEISTFLRTPWGKDNLDRIADTMQLYKTILLLNCRHREMTNFKASFPGK